MIIYCIPFIGALIGWIIQSLMLRYIIRTILPQQQPIIAAKAGEMVAGMFSIDDLLAQINDPEKIKAIMPFIDEKMDHLLKTKLHEAFPFISMFVGDGTIGKLKGMFMTEIEQMLPQLLEQYTGKLKDDLDLKAIVTDKINALDMHQLTGQLQTAAAPQLNKIKLAGAAIGFITGLIQVIITLLMPCCAA